MNKLGGSLLKIWGDFTYTTQERCLTNMINHLDLNLILREQPLLNHSSLGLLKIQKYSILKIQLAPSQYFLKTRISM